MYPVIEQILTNGGHNRWFKVDKYTGWTNTSSSPFYNTGNSNNSDIHENNKDNAALLNIPTVSETEKEISDRDISLNELKASLDDFSNNKTPGSDGLSKEFYVAFWHEMGPILLETLNFCKEIYWRKHNDEV